MSFKAHRSKTIHKGLGARLALRPFFVDTRRVVERVPDSTMCPTERWLMKITRITLFPLTGATVDGGWPQGHEPQENLHTLIQIVGEDGFDGWGSCFTSGRLVHGAIELLWPQLQTLSAIEPERTTEVLRQSSFWQGRGGAVEHAISGIDLALWDLWGKVCRQPVSRLLGGNYRHSVKPYASVLFDEPSRLSQTLSQTVAAGFKAIKLGWRPFGRVDAQFDQQLMSTARKTVGDQIDLMVDAGGSEQFWPHGVSWAKETARMLADFDVKWFEEPLRPDDLDGYRELTLQSPIPIACGEVLTRRQAFLPWINGRAVDILQPDCTKNGGLSESRRIAWAACDAGVEVVQRRVDLCDHNGLRQAGLHHGDHVFIGQRILSIDGAIDQDNG